MYRLLPLLCARLRDWNQISTILDQAAQYAISKSHETMHHYILLLKVQVSFNMGDCDSLALTNFESRNSYIRMITSMYQIVTALVNLIVIVHSFTFF